MVVAMSTGIHMVLDIHGFRSSVAMVTNTMFSRLKTNLWFKSEGEKASLDSSWRAVGGAKPSAEDSINIKELNRSSLSSRESSYTQSQSRLKDSPVPSGQLLWVGTVVSAEQACDRYFLWLAAPSGGMCVKNRACKADASAKPDASARPVFTTRLPLDTCSPR